MHLIASKTEALQQVFLNAAAAEAAANAAVDGLESANDGLNEQQDQPDSEGVTSHHEAEDERPHQEGEDVDGEQGEPEPEIEAEPYVPKPAWSVAVISFRSALKALQDKGVLGGKVTAEQALVAFHRACYQGCTSGQQHGHAG